MVLIFLFWNIPFKVCNNACIMPNFGKKIVNFYSLKKMNDTDNFEDNFFVKF